MANIDKLVCTWSGFTGAPGYTAFYFSASQGPSMQPKVVTFWQTVASYLPSVVSINVPNGGATLDETNGEQVNTWAGGAVANVPGTASAAFSAVSGCIVRWDTGQFRRGRRVRGRTFIVPLYVNAYSTSGIIFATVANAINGAAQALNSTPGQLVVWHRPLWDYTTTPPTLKAAGEHLTIVGTAVPTKVSYLSSRRD